MAASLPTTTSSTSDGGSSMSRATAFSYPPTALDWARIKEAVRALYVVEKRHLKDVRSVLRDQHGFRATERMIKARLKLWGYLKNAKKEDWYFLARLHHLRKQEGRATTAFDVRDHRKTVKDLQRFIRNQGMTVDDFIYEALRNTQGKPIPSYIRALDSVEEENPTSAEELNTISRTSSPRQSSLQTPSWSGHRNRHDSTQSNIKTDTNAYSHRIGHSDISLASRAKRAAQKSQHSGGWQSPVSNPAVGVPNTGYCGCKENQWELDAYTMQLDGSGPLKSRIGKDNALFWNLLNGPDPKGSSETYYEYICSICRQPSYVHFVTVAGSKQRIDHSRSLLNDSNEHKWHIPGPTREKGVWSWASQCFLSCILVTRGNENAAEASLREASKEFKKLLQQNDRLLLTAAGLIITILHQHDQGNIALRVMQSANHVVEALLPKRHPIRITINYLTISARVGGLAEPDCPITSADLREAYATLRDQYSPEHPLAITARHNLSWLLKHEGKFKDAESHANEVYELSARILGHRHMQSIISLATRAYCLEMLGQRSHSMSSYQRVIDDSQITLGTEHPYVLEAKRRLAAIKKQEMGGQEEALQLLRDVLWGRVLMLGRKHSYTLGARNDYERMLQDLNRWTDEMNRPTFEQTSVEALFSTDSPSDKLPFPREKRSHEINEHNNNEDELMNDDDENDNNDEAEEEDDDGDDDEDQDEDNDIVTNPASPSETNEIASY